jgi:Family of unknown function (DUF6069)
MNQKISFKNAILAGLYAGIVAAVVNAILFYIGRAAGIFTDQLEVQPGQVLTVVPVLISSILPAVIAAILFFLLDKFTGKGMLIFTIVSVLLLLLSFMNPFIAIPGITMASGVLLDVMHVTVVLGLLFFLKRAKKA